MAGASEYTELCRGNILKLHHNRGVFVKDLQGVVYKYYGFHDYVIRSLMFDEIYFSDCSLFNDIFENNFGIEDGFNLLPGSDEEKRKARKEVEELLFDIPSKARVFCASLSCDSSLMWSHYGSQHSGFCVAYSIDAITNALYFRAPNNLELSDISGAVISGEIDYVDNPPSVSWEAIVNFYKSKGADRKALEEILNVIFFNKSKDWSYEKEYRFLIPTGNKEGNFFLRLPPGSVHGIVFGDRTKKDDKDWLRCIFKDVNFYKAKSIAGKYSLELHEL